MKKFMLWFSVFLVIAGISLVFASTMYLNKNEKINFVNSDGIRLSGLYYPGGENAVIICHGFSSDWSNAYRLKTGYLSQGYSVLLFDFTGHDSSDGLIRFDNARTDRLTGDIRAAMQFMEEKGHWAENIVLAGHSMGARSILQYASNGGACKALVLIGAEVNLNENTQASFFTGAVDNDMPFVKALSPLNPPLPVLIITSEKDDIFPPDSAAMLYDAMGGGNAKYTRTLEIVENGGLHNYEMINLPIIKKSIEWTNEITGTKNRNVGGNIFTAVGWWVIGIIFLMFFPLSLYIYLGGETAITYDTVTAKPGIFILSKIMIWLVGLIPAAVLTGMIFIIPLGRPLFSVQFVVILGGYGILSSVLYSTGRMPFYRHKKHILSDSMTWNIDSLKAVPAIIGFTALSILVRISGFNKFGTGPEYLVWYILFVILMTIGFLVIGTETNIVMLSTTRAIHRIMWVIVKYMPFYLFAVFYGILGSTSGLAGAVQGLCFLFYAIYASKIVFKISENDFLAAVTIALILAQPTGALF